MTTAAELMLRGYWWRVRLEPTPSHDAAGAAEATQLLGILVEGE